MNRCRSMLRFPGPFKLTRFAFIPANRNLAGLV
jgi:hypothetical protein